MLANSRNISVISILLLFGCLFLAQDWWFISEWDDYFYKFIISDSTQTYYDQLDDGKHQMIETFGDVLRSQCNHYLGSNGRFIIHCIIQTCTALLPHKMFPILNSIAFVMLLLVLIKLADRHERPINSLFTVSSLLIGCPVVMAVFMANISVSVNYLWSGAAVLWWYYAYERMMQEEKELPPMQIAILAIASIIAGSLQESYSIGLCAGLLLHHIFNIKKLNLSQIVMIGAFGLGACICIFAPSNFSRLGGQIDLRAEAKWYLLESYIFVAFLLLSIISLIFSRDKFIKYVKKNIVLLVAIVANICFVTLIVFSGAQQLTAIKLWSCILFLRLLYSYEGKKICYAKYVLVFISLFSCVLAYPRMYELRRHLGNSYNSLVDYAFVNKPKIIVDTEYEDDIHQIESSIFNKYFHSMPINGAGSLSIYITEGKSRNYIEGIIPLPMDTIEKICRKTINDVKITHLRNHTYTYVSDKKYEPETVHLNIWMTFRNPNKLHKVKSHARCRVWYGGRYYYFFKTHSNRFDSNPITIGN